ncbi:superoxide dismutase family protein [Geodermatophilus sp. DSM 44513]|uniref:superoxide dismutase family protein n=1 Tax=Geodermatophilus sp. DSM 44513 TaxID=1528104 RepID=UPI00126C5D81|nr:superoxide dismutase family protein [Geodermatophilus sp. DSM 44513]WNV77673.1 superoxide dismutase family protein [Geodermatophilus sp. DSM 44513]
MHRTLLPAAAVLLALTACAADDGEQLREDLAAVTAAEAAPRVPDSGEGEGPEEEQDDRAVLEPAEVPTDLVDPEGSVIGTAYLRDEQRGTEVEVEVMGMTPGFHGVGLYDVGACDAAGAPAEAFSSVGELLTPLPPVLVLDNGVGVTTALVDSAPVVEELLVGNGTAVVIGDAAVDLAAAQAPPVGSRMACAAFTG